MNDVATLVTSIGFLITALGTATAGVITALRTSRRERPAAARKAIEQMLAAAEDGEITPEEAATIAKSLGRHKGKGAGE